MAAANLVRSAFNGLLRKSTTYKAPVICRLSTVAVQQKYHAIKNITSLYCNERPQNGVSLLIDKQTDIRNTTHICMYIMSLSFGLYISNLYVQLVIEG